MSTRSADKARLVDALGLAHRRLEVGRLEVLPVLLQQRHEEVQRHDGVLADLILRHLSVADARAEAQNLLELELDRRLELEDLLGEVVRLSHGCGELTSTVHVRADETRDCLDNRLGGKEGIVLVAHLLHELLVLVELLQVVLVLGHELVLLGNVLVDEVAQNAHTHAWAAHVGQAERAGETLVLVGVVVLQVDLKVNRLLELALLAVLQDRLNGL